MALLILAAGSCFSLVTAKLLVLSEPHATDPSRSRLSGQAWLNSRFASYRRQCGTGPIIVSALLLRKAA